MLDSAADWLSFLPPTSFSGVHGVQGVQPQKSATFERTPVGVQRCASTPVHTDAHHSTPDRVQPKPPENGASTPCTPCTPNFDDGGDPIGMIGVGLDQLRRRRCPKQIPFGTWSIIVGDALRLLDDGWVEKAISLGWAVSDLYGIPLRDSRPFTSLAAWLDCRRVTMIDADGAHAGPWCRGFMGPPAGRYRRGTTPRPQSALLWNVRNGDAA